MTATPPIVDRETWQDQLDALRVREKAHTREGDAIAAARRRLPMVEVDPQTPLIGADGPVPLLDVFDGRSSADRLLPHVAPRPAGRGAVRGLHLLHDPHQRAVVPALARRELRDLL